MDGAARGVDGQSRGEAAPDQEIDRSPLPDDLVDAGQPRESLSGETQRHLLLVLSGVVLVERDGRDVTRHFAPAQLLGDTPSRQRVAGKTILDPHARERAVVDPTCVARVSEGSVDLVSSYACSLEAISCLSLGERPA